MPINDQEEDPEHDDSSNYTQYRNKEENCAEIQENRLWKNRQL
jgi:hypothetical protein